MEFIVKIGIYIHAFFGTIALLSGLGSMLFQKGSKNHKKSGKMFSISMIISSVLSLPIAWMPNHKNMFLFLIGIFTIYLVLSGNRILLFKNKSKANLLDKFISGSLFFSAILMLVFGILHLHEFHWRQCSTGGTPLFGQFGGSCQNAAPVDWGSMEGHS